MGTEIGTETADLIDPEDPRDSIDQTDLTDPNAPKNLTDSLLGPNSRGLILLRVLPGRVAVATPPGG
jgi:hypothetical protein